MVKFIFITNHPELAAFALWSGVQRIMVDLEINGKYARQGHLNTLISLHAFADIKAVKASMVRSGQGELIVRLNPWSIHTQDEVDKAIQFGADLLMLPMFFNVKEVQAFVDCVAGRVGVIPLVETKAAAAEIAAIAAIDGVSEVFIGLNDLHLDMGLKFMFEPVASGMIEELVTKVHAVGKACGFGGIARVAQGMVPGEMVLAEHVRLGSDGVILSRDFHSNNPDLAKVDLQDYVELPVQLAHLREQEDHLRSLSQTALLALHEQFCTAVNTVVSKR